MKLKTVFLIFLFLLLFLNWPKNLRAEDSNLCFNLEDSQKLYLCIEQVPILEEKIVTLETENKNLEKENNLLKQELSYQEKLTQLAEREAEIYKKAFDAEKELTDRALKLAETKPKSIWIYIAGILVAFGIGLAIGL